MKEPMQIHIVKQLGKQMFTAIAIKRCKVDMVHFDLQSDPYSHTGAHKMNRQLQ